MKKNKALWVFILSVTFIFPITTHIYANSEKKLLCDELAGHPLDPNKKGSGIEFNKINAPAAIVACIKNLENDPNNMRLLMNLGRAYNKKAQYNDSFRYAQRSAYAGYPFAYHLLSLHYLYGEGTVKDRTKEIKYLKMAATLGVALSLQKIVGIELEEEFMRIDFDRVYNDIESAIKLGVKMDKALGDFYCRLNDKIKFDILNAKSIDSLDLVKLQMYRDNFIKAQLHYQNYLQLNKDDKTKVKLNKVIFALENKSTEANIQNKITLKKTLSKVSTLPKRLEFNYEFGSKLSVNFKAKKWGMLTDSGQFLGSTFLVSGNKAKMKDMFGDDAWRTAKESWRYIQRYNDTWKIVVYGHNQLEVRSFILSLRDAMLDSHTHALVYVIGIVE